MLGKGETWQYTLEVRGGGADGGFEGKARDVADIRRDRPMTVSTARLEIQCRMHVSVYLDHISGIYLGHISAYLAG